MDEKEAKVFHSLEQLQHYNKNIQKKPKIIVGKWKFRFNCFVLCTCFDESTNQPFTTHKIQNSTVCDDLPINYIGYRIKLNTSKSKEMYMTYCVCLLMRYLV